MINAEALIFVEKELETVRASSDDPVFAPLAGYKAAHAKVTDKGKLK